MRRLTIDQALNSIGGNQYPISSAAFEASHILSPRPANLVYLTGYNSGAAQFIQVHDSATLPADTAVPLFVQAILGTSNFGPFGPFACRNGIVVCNSTTAPTKTIGSANCWFQATII